MQSSEYRRSVESLRLGDASEDDLGRARALRNRLLRVAENISELSGHIESLREAGSAEIPPLRKQLQRRIRLDAGNFIKATLVGLPDVPSEDEFEELRRRRVREAEERVEREKRSARQAKERAAAAAAECSSSKTRNNKATGSNGGSGLQRP